MSHHIACFDFATSPQSSPEIIAVASILPQSLADLLAATGLRSTVRRIAIAATNATSIPIPIADFPPKFTVIAGAYDIFATSALTGRILEASHNEILLAVNLHEIPSYHLIYARTYIIPMEHFLAQLSKIAQEIATSLLVNHDVPIPPAQTIIGTQRYGCYQAWAMWQITQNSAQFLACDAATQTALQVEAIVEILNMDSAFSRAHLALFNLYERDNDDPKIVAHIAAAIQPLIHQPQIAQIYALCQLQLDAPQAAYDATKQALITTTNPTLIALHTIAAQRLGKNIDLTPATKAVGGPEAFQIMLDETRPFS